MTPFLTAAKKGDLKSLKDLFEKHKKEQIMNQCEQTSRKTALHFAAENGHLEVVKWLMANGASINAVDADRNTPIFLAAISLNLEMVDLLLTYSPSLLNFVKENLAETPITKMDLRRVKIIEEIERIQREWILLSINQEEAAKLVITLRRFDEIFAKIRPAMLKEAQKIVSQSRETGQNYTCVRITKNGSLSFGQVQNLLPKDFENKNKVSLMCEDQEILFSFKGKSVSPEERNRMANLKVPPLVFFVNHLDDATFDLIVRQFKFLKDLGYSTVCFEYDHDTSLSETIHLFKEGQVQFEIVDERDSAADRRDKKENAEIMRLHIKFFERLQKETGIKYAGIDEALGVYRHRDFIPILYSKFADAMRETGAAKRMIYEINNTQGGTITLLGLGHTGIQKKLFEENPGIASKAQYYYCYSEKTIKNMLDSGTPNDLDSSLRYNASAMGFIEIDVQKGIKAADTKFRKALLEKIDCRSILATEYKKLNIKTTALSNLKHVLDLPFEGFCNSEYQVEARLGVKSYAEFEALQAQITEAIPNLVKPPRFVKNEQGQWELVIPEINGVNNTPIQDAAIKKQENIRKNKQKV